jgi:hypothetical protein
MIASQRGAAVRLAIALLSSASLATGLLAAQPPPPPRQGPPGASEKQLKSLAKFAEPWPDATELARQRADAEARALFSSEVPLPFSLSADFKALNRDRDLASTKVYPGVLTVAGANGQPVAIPVELRPRGNLRRQARVCDFVPVRVEFVKEDRAKLAGTPFDGQKQLKLVTHCRAEDEFEQYILREYLMYKAFNLVTPRSFRARLAKPTYVDASTGKTVAARTAFFLESDDDLARRMDARVAVLPRTRFADHDPDTLAQTMLFEFLLGNTDFSIFMLHNIVVVKTQANVLYPIPYDFDVSGLVSPPYAIPSTKLGIQSVRDRLYRGPCRTAAEWDPVLAAFRAKQAEILALFDRPDVSRSSREVAKAYLADFFTLIASPARVKRKLIDTCNKETV